MDTELVSNIIKFNAQTNGRDKMCRLFQYGCRLAWGQMEVKNKSDFVQTLKNIEYMFSMTRKLLRFGKSLDFIQAALKSIHLKDHTLRLTITLAKINQAFYLLFDHFLWFNNVGAVTLDKQYWGRLSARFYLATLTLNFLRDLYGIWQVIREELKQRAAAAKGSAYRNGDRNYSDVSKRLSTVEEVAQQNIPLILDFFKNSFDLAIPLSTLGYLKLSPRKQGIYGIISSSIAVATVWNSTLKLVPS